MIICELINTLELNVFGNDSILSTTSFRNSDVVFISSLDRVLDTSALVAIVN